MSDGSKIVLQPFGEAGEVCDDEVCVVPPRVVGSADPV
jgi:hypothetical protein